MLKGELFIYQRKFAEAIELFAQLLKEEPRSARAYYFKGIAHLGIGDTKIARTELEKALSLDQNFDGADNAKQILSKF